MKKNIFSFALMCSLMLLVSSCFDDDSTAWENPVTRITIDGIESAYEKTAYVNDRLQIHPVVETGPSDDKIQYKWILINEKTGTTTAQGDTIQPIEIGTTKDLDYEVNVAPGKYQIRLSVTDTITGNAALAYAMLTVQTNFSKGFYILKETADGNTELDELDFTWNLAENLLTKIDGQPMPGKPANLCQMYDQNYINQDNDEVEATNGLIISSEKDFGFYRSTDMKRILDRTNIFFDDSPTDEVIYGTFASSFNAMLISSKGFYSFSGGTGQFGMPDVECNGSPYYYIDFAADGGGAYWNPTTHGIYAFDYLLNPYPLTDANMGGEDITQNLTNYDCLHCSYSYAAWTERGYVILRNNANQDRYLYLIDGSFSGQYLNSRVKLDPNSHMAKAEHYATNGSSASYIYCAEGGKLYACITNTGDFSEVEIKPEGIPSGEYINFVANQFWDDDTSGTPFNYLIVGTQSGNNYKLYLYETNGGAPVGKPVKTVEGTGKVCKVRYLNSTSSLYMKYGFFYAFSAYD